MSGDIDEIINDCYDEIVNHIERNHQAYMHLMNHSVDWVPYGSASVSMESSEITDECVMQAAQDMWEAELINYVDGKYTTN